MTVQKIIVSVLLCILFTGCRETPQVPAGPREKVVIDLALPQAFLVQLAFTKGYFANEGLDATLRLQTSGKAALQGVLAGKADLATVSETPIVFARQFSMGLYRRIDLLNGPAINQCRLNVRFVV
jgi:ABC-type nitrate/sulfonate/bicarbonate transport system substrate-binding protein